MLTIVTNGTKKRQLIQFTGFSIYVDSKCMEVKYHA